MITDVIQDIWDKIRNFLPDFLGAIIVLILGWIIADLLAWVVDRILRLVRLPDLFKTAKVEELVKKAGSRLDTTGLIAAIVKWVFLLVSFITAADILQLQAVRSFLEDILQYLPNVVAAGAILLLGAIFAHFMASLIKGAISAAKLNFAEFVGNITKYVILVFSILVALDELGIGETYLQTLFVGVVAFVAIAGGLAFGLGGQTAAKDLLEKFRREMES